MRNLLLSLLTAIAVTIPVSAETPDEELTRLRKDVQTLREENQTLRRLLATPSPSQAATVAPGAQATSPTLTTQAADAAETGFWMSSTGKRHNAKCRYYKTSKGHFCAPTEGTACKVCGG